VLATERLSIDVSVFNSVVGVVSIRVSVDVLERGLDGLAFSLESLGISNLGGIDLSLGDINVSLISPESVRSQILSGSVNISLVGDVCHGSASVVRGDLHCLSVLVSLDLGNLLMLSLSFLELLKGEGWADFHDISDFVRALLRSIDHLASLEVIEVSLAGSRKRSALLNNSVVRIMRRVGEVDQIRLCLETTVDRVVVSSEESGENDRVWIGLGIEVETLILSTKTCVKTLIYRCGLRWKCDQLQKD
jgi:hypothetical protein